MALKYIRHPLDFSATIAAAKLLRKPDGRRALGTHWLLVEYMARSGVQSIGADEESIELAALACMADAEELKADIRALVACGLLEADGSAIASPLLKTSEAAASYAKELAEKRWSGKKKT